MKTKIFIYTLVISTLIFSCKKDNKTKHNDVPKAQEETTVNFKSNGRHCFMYVLENTYEKDGKKITDKDYINVDLNIDNNKVDGIYKITSKEGDINKGHFVGTIKDDIITTIHTYNKEDKVLKDELVFKIEVQKISILGGEKKMVNGVNVFVDKSKCDYMLEIPRVNCN